MHPDRPSTTAEMVCAWRALEALLPPERRIVDDPYARGFLGPSRAALIDLVERLPARARVALARRVDRLLQGAMTFVMGRHRAIDDLLRQPRGWQQVVLLGTGYDSRAVRLADALARATVFEVDHPATARRRHELAPRVFGGAPRAPTVDVSIDFNRESLEVRLRESGFVAGRLCFWVWEGVSMYLDEAAVRATLDLVRRLSAPGSLIACDVWCPPAGGLRQLTQRDLPALAFKLIYEEALTWGVPRAGLGALLRDHGLALIEDVPAEELVARYQPISRGLLQVGTNMVFAVGEVDRPG